MEPRLFSQALEDYVKAIYKLQQQEREAGGEPSASTTSLARAMGTTPAAATKMIKHLAEHKMADHTPYRGVRLTPVGEKVALEVIRHHRLLESYLHEALGYGWDEVDAEAERLEHHISEAFEERIERMLGNPQTDPHGDPIPTRDGVMPPARGTSLAEAETGDTLVVVRVSDRSAEALRYLAHIGMTIEAIVEVTDKQPFNGPLTLRIGDATHALGRELAGHVFTEPTEPRQERGAA
jgi:DtxR family Mn-dependent transcriptional regulator